MRMRISRNIEKRQQGLPKNILWGKAMMMFFLFTLFLSFSSGALGETNSSPFASVREAWEKEHYGEAKGLLEKMLLLPEIPRGTLYYNLGAAEEALNNSGKALLWYLRGARSEPANPLIRQGIQRTFPEGNALPLPWQMAFWNRFLSFSVIAWLGMLFWFSFWIALGAALFTRKTRFRFWAKLLLLPALLLGGMALWNGALDKWVPLGVVTEKESILRSGYSQNATPLYSLPEGSVLRILENRDGFSLVRTPGGNRGWIPEKECTPVNEKPFY